jgi:methylenetetrahydrofolate reductase (NADPH)
MKRPIAVSFEFFPPGDAAMEQTLWRSVEHLAPLRPRFISVTYGADGSTRERTHHVVRRLLSETALTPAPHLTCVGASREVVLDTARDYWRAGVRHIVALRGDPPQGSEGYLPHWCAACARLATSISRWRRTRKRTRRRRMHNLISIA